MKKTQVKIDPNSIDEAILQYNLRKFSPVRKVEHTQSTAKNGNKALANILEMSPVSPPTMPNTLLKSFSSFRSEMHILDENNLKVLSKNLHKLGEGVSRNVLALQEQLEVNKKLSLLLCELEKKVSEKKSVCNESTSQANHCQNICEIQ